jgi:outer membrane protein assembly factor BamB
MRGKRLRIAVVLVAVGLLASGAATAYWVAKRPAADIHRGDELPFLAPTSAPSEPATTSEQPAKKKERNRPDWGPAWRFYGRTLSRTRDASDLTGIRPPFASVWRHDGQGLLEYPPSYVRGVLYLTSNAGWASARDARTGKRLWARRVGAKVAAQPAVSGGRVYFGDREGRVFALSARTGRVLWRTEFADKTESPPALAGDRLYVSDIGGTVRALAARTGRTLWRFQADGPVKHGPALVGGRLYFGDYAGVMYCLRASDGSVLWRTATHGLASGLESGGFYSTPAVAYGRVYAGNLDHKVYSFVAATGEIAWTHTLPHWAYGSPAVVDGRVFATSFDGTFAALSARTGDELWSRQLPYGSLASPTVIGPYVYVTDLGRAAHVHGHLYAYNPGNGRLVWTFPDGKYSTVIAAGDRLVVAGFGKLYSLRPRRR